MAFVFIFNWSLPTLLLVQIQFRLPFKKTSKLHSIVIFWEVGDPTVTHGFLSQRQRNARKDKTIYDVSIIFSGLRYKRGKDIAYEASDVVSLILKIRLSLGPSIFTCQEAAKGKSQSANETFRKMKRMFHAPNFHFRVIAKWP